MGVEQYLYTLLSEIAHDPIDIQRTEDDKGVLFSVTPSSRDIGTILGRGAETIDAVRRLMRVKGALHNEHIAIKVVTN